MGLEDDIDEIENLKDDIETYIRINSEYLAEIEQLRARCVAIVEECARVVATYDYDELFGMHPKDILVNIAVAIRALKEKT